MMLFGKKVPILFSLAIWFIVWELIGQAKLSTIIPPFSGVLAAGLFRARGRLTRNESAAARKGLEELVARHPRQNA